MTTGSPIEQRTALDFQMTALLLNILLETKGDVTPGAGNVGHVYRRSSDGHIRYVRDASTVVDLDLAGRIVNADVATGAAIALSKLATDPLARANHTGTQLAATVSDFDTQVRTSRLDQMAAPTGNVSLNSHKITNLLDATADQDAATLGQVNTLLAAVSSGFDWKASVRVAALTNVTISSPGATIDGVTLTTGDRVLLAGQTTGSQNGIYVFNGSSSAMTRATDADASAEVTGGLTVAVAEGTSADKLAILTTNDTITLGTTSLAFAFIAGPGAYSGSTYIQVSGGVLILLTVGVDTGGTGATTAAGARSNLNVPQRGFAANIGALTAGTGLDVTHSLGTLDVLVQVFRNSDGATVSMGTARKDTNTVTVTADIDSGSNVYRLVVVPIA